MAKGKITSKLEATGAAGRAGRSVLAVPILQVEGDNKPAMS
jgi:hypothetical protein